ncbi:hypothetical protein [Nonomuraea endophytica]|uniref:hypothetical protein n=1 Tax=Nonomuraea endophytica TaxID=714136 RepID=UPI0037C5B504
MAAYLEAQPDLPVPFTIDIAAFPQGDEPTRIAEVRRIAELLDLPVETNHGHIAATLPVGRARYRVVAVSDDASGRWSALITYVDHVRPNTDREG